MLFRSGSSASPDSQVTTTWRQLRWIETVIVVGRSPEVSFPEITPGGLLVHATVDPQFDFSPVEARGIVEGTYTGDVWGNPIVILGDPAAIRNGAVPDDMISSGRNGVFERGRGDDLRLSGGVNFGHYWRSLQSLSLACVVLAVALVGVGVHQSLRHAESVCALRTRRHRVMVCFALLGAAVMAAGYLWDGRTWSNGTYGLRSVPSRSAFVAGAAVATLAFTRWLQLRVCNLERGANACASCGYSRDGLGDRPCPECGLRVEGKAGD
ncbi:MAG: hypothetical protein AAFP26_05595 [Planctomycetota bacterium]